MAAVNGMQNSVGAAADLAYTQFARLPHALNTSNDEAALRQAARHFESLFIDMWLKSARDGTRALAPDSIFATPELEMHQEMADHETALHLAREGGVGLADAIVAQLKGQALLSPQPLREDFPSTATGGASALPETAASVAGQGAPAITRHGSRQAAFASPTAFVATLEPLIAELTKQTTLPALGVLSQAALETGWGQHVIADGADRSSHNLFGVKARPDDSAAWVEIASREFEFGRWVERVDAFKAYENWPDSISDYLKTLAAPRYAAVHETVTTAPDEAGMLTRVAQFAERLKEAGYATDPDYAAKIVGVARRILSGAF